jgi:hypothetical protein
MNADRIAFGKGANHGSRRQNPRRIMDTMHRRMGISRRGPPEQLFSHYQVRNLLVVCHEGSVGQVFRRGAEPGRLTARHYPFVMQDGV